MNTMILSQLWHYTAVLAVPLETLERWQSMVLKFILGRRLHRTDHNITVHHCWHTILVDYIFLDTALTCTSYKVAKYFAHDNAGDHLCHAVTLQTIHQPYGRGYWKLPNELLLIPEVASTIVAEARTLLATLTTSANRGVVWDS